MTTIRKATLADVDQVRELGKNVKGFETSEGTITFRPKEILKNCINKEDVLIYVAENREEKKIVGFIIGNLNHSLKKAELENIYVHESQRHQGIGKSLMEAILTEITSLNIENVCALTTNTYITDFTAQFNFEKGEQFFRMDLVLSDNFKK
ncbi:MAG: GNAT family N-acetyltransferase [Candidatus Peribacteria bacterium]|jgi:N-acetylglutamate synthase-like GNAT family acetyltransferase|nr:GNAT family N-acetyltransferase [Candidatus Peribacteria bacterium]